jgi:hypothetical protein
MYYSYVEIEYVATSFSPARMDLALKLLSARARRRNPGTVSTKEATATAPPWFLARAKNLVVRR